MKPRSVVGIELFSGCGGLSTGFLDAGLHVAAGFEWEARAVDVYNYNHAYRGSMGVRYDLSEAKAQDLLDVADVKRIDFLIGGPPCQPFSIAGKRKGTKDERASLLDHYVRFVHELNPEAFLLENVPNLASIDNGDILKRVEQRLRRLGYGVRYEVVKAADFGVPQMRKRLVMVGIYGKSEIEFPTPTHGEGLLPYVTVRDAIGDLPDAGEFGETGIHNHEPTAHSDQMIRRFEQLSQGKRERSSFHDRLHPDKLSYTLRAGYGNFSPLRPIHHIYHRVITARESARLQGLSDDFIWPDRIPRLQQYRQVGNAVPPPLAKAFARCIAKQLGWKTEVAKCKGVPSDREAPMVLTDDQRRAERRSRVRGASLGKLLSAAE
jgi:DNA (cytosine-5)-methyltransferase 1